MRIGQKAVRTQIALAAVVLLGCGPAHAGAGDAYYERAFVVAAHERCDLFSPQISAALNAAAVQARGAAMRAGVTASDLAAVERRARGRAGAVSCRDPELATVRNRVDHAFSGWARTPRMTFPGSRLDWTADRYGWDRTGWRLKQATAIGGSPVAFGYAGPGDSAELTAVISWRGKPRPYAARIVLRDSRRLGQPWLAGHGLPPSAARASFWASQVNAAAPDLLGKGRSAGESWRFHSSAAEALERLDPREAFTVEFHFRDGSVATAWFEAGDFAAGRAFLALGKI